MSIFGVFHGGTLSLSIWCHFSWARPLGWLIPKRCYRPQLFSTLVSRTSLMDKVLSDYFSCKNVDFRRFHGGTLSLGIWCHFSWARPLGWLIMPKRCQRPISFRAKMSIFDVFDGGALHFGLWCHFSWARPLGWLIPERCYRPQLFST